MRERLARWWAHRRLRAGQCQTCSRVLRDDDQRGGFCSLECAQSRAW